MVNPERVFCFIALLLLVFAGCSDEGDSASSTDNIGNKTFLQEKSEDLQHESREKQAGEPVTAESIHGRWKLHYRGNYGYDFYFGQGYNARIIISLNTQYLVFHGVYTVKDGVVTINVFKMKSETDRNRVYAKKDFIKVKSSKFEFNGTRVKSNGRSMLYLKPGVITIDGHDSRGYFEPLLKLRKI